MKITWILLSLLLTITSALASYQGDKPNFVELEASSGIVYLGPVGVNGTYRFNANILEVRTAGVYVTAQDLINLDASKITSGTLAAARMSGANIISALTYTPEDVANKATVLTSNDNTHYPTTAAINTALALKAPLASPALTGTPTAPTAAPGTNTTQIATTAYTDAAIAAIVDSDAFVVSSHAVDFTATCNSQNIITASLSMTMPAPVAGCVVKVKSAGAFTVTTVQSGSENLETAAASYVYSDNLRSVTWFTDGTDYFIE